MKDRQSNILAAVLLFLCLIAGCTATINCGTWAFSGTPVSASSPAAFAAGTSFPNFPLSSAFTFTPATCNQNCNSSTDVMIQMVYVYDMSTQTMVFPTSSYAARQDANGWVIDRVDGAAYGYYGLENDGSTFYSGWNTTGGPGTANTLFDRPQWNVPILFYSVDAAVCWNSKDCNNRIDGYYFWSWSIDSNGTASKFIVGPAWQDLNVEFQSALSSWNSWAPSSGSENDGFGSPTLPHAVVFPTLSDL